MTTLVTGGIGWVPSYIVRRLARRGEHVVVYDVMQPDAMFNDFLGDLHSNVTVVHGDVTDGAHLLATAREHDVTRIVHTAAITPRVEWERADPARIINVNIMGTVNALDAARQLPNFERYVHLGSVAAWGSGHDVDVRDEDTPTRATGLYGVTKYAGERIALRYAELFGLDVVSLRPSSVYGPMERFTPGYIGATELREMLRILLDGEELRVNSLAGPYHEWTFVEDIAEGVERAWATSRLPHSVYTLTCGVQYSIGDMLDAFQRAWPEIRVRVVDPSEANYHVSGDAPGPRASNARMLADFGWVPATPLDEGVAAYLAWVRANGAQ